VNPLQIALGVVVGLMAGTLSGLFGVGGGVITQPAVYALLGGTPIQSVATPLPVIFPTSVMAAYAYARAGEVSYRAARWGATRRLTPPRSESGLPRSQGRGCHCCHPRRRVGNFPTRPNPQDGSNF